MSKTKPKAAVSSSAAESHKKGAEQSVWTQAQDAARSSGLNADVAPAIERVESAGEPAVRGASIVDQSDGKAKEDAPELTATNESATATDVVADTNAVVSDTAFDMAMHHRTEEPLPTMTSAQALKNGDTLRCVQFPYLGQTHDIRGVVVSVDDEGDVLLELPTLSTMWPVMKSRVSLSAIQSGAFVGTWQHAESDYPKLGEDNEFDIIFRKAALDEHKTIMAQRWNPPRKARAGYIWILVKLSLQVAGFDVKGAASRKFSAGQYAEVPAKSIEGIEIAVESV